LKGFLSEDSDEAVVGRKVLRPNGTKKIRDLAESQSALFVTLEKE